MPDDKRHEPRVVELGLQLAFGSIEELILRYALDISQGPVRRKDICA